jgi:hypothetical protein
MGSDEPPVAAACNNMKQMLVCTVTGICDKAVLLPLLFIIGCLTILVGLWQLTRQDVYVIHAVIQTDRLVHRTDARFLSIALDTSNIQDGWVHENIK